METEEQIKDRLKNEIICICLSGTNPDYKEYKKYFTEEEFKKIRDYGEWLFLIDENGHSEEYEWSEDNE